MALSELPVLAMLRTRMQWHQERQRLLAENVANADTPSFKPRDLAPPDFTKPPVFAVTLGRTDAGHMAGSGAADGAGGFAIRSSGKAVTLEDEMLKIAANQMDYQQAATLYAKGLGLVKTALGRR